jgi:glutamine synthetase
MAAYTLAQLKADVASGVIDTVIVAFPDMQGRLIGKRFQAEFFLEGAIDETHACDYLMADDIDMEPVPWLRRGELGEGLWRFRHEARRNDADEMHLARGHALILADLIDHHHHEPIPHAPRNILKAQLARLEKMGLTANFASELEFYLFDEDFRTIHEKGHRNLKTAGYYIEDYHIFQTTKEEGVMRALRKHLMASGIPVENSKGEWGPGQEEINVKYADALTMADRHVVLKNATKEIAHLQGKAVTFMAKWDFGLAGSSSHIHMSLAKSGKNVFVDAKDPLGMAPIMKQFMAGLLTYAGDITYFLAPYINSYKRFQAAPSRRPSDLEPRQPHCRLPPLRREHQRRPRRMPHRRRRFEPLSGLCRPHCSGARGIEEKLTLEPVFTGDAYSARSSAKSTRPCATLPQPSASPRCSWPLSAAT